MKPTKYYYSHLINIESVTTEIGKLDLNASQKTHLGELVHSCVHHTILNVTLSGLRSEHKRQLLENLAAGDPEKTWKFLNEQDPEIEKKIRVSFAELRTEILRDIKDAFRVK